MLTKKTATLATLLVGLVLAGLPVAALAQDSADGKKVQQYWEDLLHYIRVAQVDAAKSNALALLQSGASPRDVYLLSVKNPQSLTALTRGRRLEGLDEPLAKLREMIEKGYEAERSDAEQIELSIQMLARDSLRAVEEATRRLAVSGEYALPQLVGKLAEDDTSERLRERIINVLPKIGVEGVRGLSAAMQSDDHRVLEAVAYALGQIGYGHAAPRLREAMAREDLLERTRKIIRAALVRCAGSQAVAKSVAETFYDSARKYYYRAESLQPTKDQTSTNLWYWQDGLGLTFKPVPEEVFCDVYAMRYARLALHHDETYYPAVSLWLSATIRKEADLPEGATDPVRGQDEPPASYYALASSPKYVQQVLAQALEDKNAAVAIRAIESLAKTAGAKSLVEPVEGGAQPLVAAMSYPNRQVRFLAAWALANARPDTPFDGRQLVVPTLAQAIRQTGRQTALLVVGGEEGNRLKAGLREQGMVVLHEPQPSEALLAATDAAGVDVIVLGASPDPASFVAAVRRVPVLSATPVLVTVGNTTSRSLAKQDQAVAVIEEGQDVQAGLATAMALAGGESLSADQAVQWAERAANSLLLLGMTRNEVLNYARAESALLDALEVESDRVKVAAARALAAIPTAKAQRGIVSLAVSDASPAVRVIAFNAACESVRTFGSQLTDALISDVVAVVQGDQAEELRLAAAQLHGALNLPSEKLTELIRSAGTEK
jgi:hypothetical protein